MAGLTAEEVTSGIWRYFVPGGAVACDSVRFMPDGAIAGLDSPGERRWRIENGALCFLAEGGAPSARFDQDVTRNGILTLQGRSSRAGGETMCIQRRDWSVLQAHKDSTRVVFAAEIDKLGWQVGRHTYGRPVVFERDARLIIGHFTSIALNVQVALGNHRTDLASTYPFATLGRFWPSAPIAVVDHEHRGDVSIGSDVWLGTSCFIGAGVTVGDGAVVGAHAVVTQDVPPYAVVVGNPARIVRLRFEPRVVDRLLRIAWWNWPDEKIDRYLPLILSDDLWQFIRAARREEKREAAV